MKRATIALLLICTAAFAQQKGSFTDTRDKKTYKTVKIGEQTWMAENLNYDAKGSKCYDNKPANCTKYCRLYDWTTAMNIDAKFNEEKWDGSDAKHSGICPSGWHLPSGAEWDTLEVFAGGGHGKAGKKLKAKSGWNKTPDNKNSNGTDNYGFSALPGGGGFSDGNFYHAGGRGFWWSTSENDIVRYMSHTYEDEDYGPDDVHNIGFDSKPDLYSVRCVKD